MRNYLIALLTGRNNVATGAYILFLQVIIFFDPAMSIDVLFDDKYNWILSFKYLMYLIYYQEAMQPLQLCFCYICHLFHLRFGK